MARAPDAAGWSIPNYRLIKQVGQGAFGEVWLAEEVLTRICRAVKIVPGAGRSKSAHRRIELEGVRQYQQRSSGHDHLIQVLTVGETADSLYYVMEAADNALGSRAASLEDYEPATLASVVAREGRLSLDIALGHVASMLAGAEHLHSVGLAHRDLKPSNVLFVGGVLKLADVGLASRDSTASVGTPGYRAPDGTPDDLYAIGVMLYEMITGQPPSRFPELPADLGLAHDSRQLREVLRVINRACHPASSERFGSAAQFANAIRRRALPTSRRAARTTRRVLYVSFVAVLAVSAWLAYLWVSTPNWSGLMFVWDAKVLSPGQWRQFPERQVLPSEFRLHGASLDSLGRLTLQGGFQVGHPEPGCIMALMLAVDDEILHLIYYGVPEAGRHSHQFDGGRTFRFRDNLLKRCRGDQPIPVYVVLAPTDDFFAFCSEYATYPGKCNRLCIGHIQRRYGH